ncbi:MAG: histidine kinase [Campylobacterales bacterium 16-40-21]|nr:MAG: histidine kinase [Campylobacterales bacterium 16-40-21]
MTLSLKTKIRLLFAFLFILLILAILPFHEMQETKADDHVVRYYEKLAEHIHKERLSKEETTQYLYGFNFRLVENPHPILHHAKHPIMRKKGFETIAADGHYYLHIITPNFRILFKDDSNTFERSYVDIYLFVLVMILFMFIYYLIMKNINDAQEQLKSRQLFLRTIMHELKTPIAKGRIVSELIDDEKQKNRIITIFEKLTHLIDDFAKVEQVVSNNYSLNLHAYKMNIIVQKSIDMLLLEKTDTIKLRNISFEKIIEEEENLLFISNGERIEKPLTEYFKPFHTDTKNKNHGMGLGLYIVHSILQMHHMTLEYEYRDGQNIFRVVYSHLR